MPLASRDLTTPLALGVVVNAQLQGLRWTPGSENVLSCRLTQELDRKYAPEYCGIIACMVHAWVLVYKVYRYDS